MNAYTYNTIPNFDDLNPNQHKAHFPDMGKWKKINEYGRITNSINEGAQPFASLEECLAEAAEYCRDGYPDRVFVKKDGITTHTLIVSSNGETNLVEGIKTLWDEISGN